MKTAVTAVTAESVMVAQLVLAGVILLGASVVAAIDYYLHRNPT